MFWIIRGLAVSGGSDTVIDDWTTLAPSKAVAKMDQRLNFLKDRPTSEWQYDYAHPLTGGSGLWEIKFEWANIAYRPLFFFGPNRRDLTIVFFAEERGGKWSPRNAQDIAIVRMVDTIKNPKKALQYDS